MTMAKVPELFLTEEEFLQDSKLAYDRALDHEVVVTNERGEVVMRLIRKLPPLEPVSVADMDYLRGTPAPITIRVPITFEDDD